MVKLFPNQDYGRDILKHIHLPVYITEEFNFFRCLALKDDYYGMTVSQLFAGNLRDKSKDNRYSCLFSNKKVSYWADSPQTARKEVSYHTNDIKGFITFWAYDDATSFSPMFRDRKSLVIADGRDIEFGKILEKHENGKILSQSERKIVNAIESQDLDCLAYQSLRNKNGVNYLFFEKGFKKLAVREVKLRYRHSLGGATSTIACAVTSDYIAIPENYGMCFMPKARIKMEPTYLESKEYRTRMAVIEANRRYINEQVE